MSRIRRTHYVAFTCTDGKSVDIGTLLRGRVELVPVAQPAALSALTGARHPLSRDELDLALEVPEAWTSREDLLRGRDPADDGRLDELARKGVVVTDEPTSELVELRRRDEALTDDHWSPQAAQYHFGAKWRDVRVGLGVEPLPDETVDELIARADEELERLGAPPPHFVTLPDPAAVVQLPRAHREGQLYEALLRRETSRGFDRAAHLTIDQLSAILWYAWGCQGLAEISDSVAIVKKTSPSGGGLHPVEVYPLVRDVESVSPGLYHYSVRDHALELIRELDAEGVEELALVFTAGQAYFRPAHVLFLLTGRFPRSFWKYREHPRAYGVMLMDAGHLSQTFYLVCTELGLGAFVTAAINGANIEEALELDGYREGAIAICGCGPPGPEPPGLQPPFAPYPR